MTGFKVAGSNWQRLVAAGFCLALSPVTVFSIDSPLGAEARPPEFDERPDFSPEPEVLEVPPVAERPLDEADAVALPVERIVLEGVTENRQYDVSKQEMAALAEHMRATAAANEAGITIFSLQRIAAAISGYYRDRGYVLARAVVPAQTIDEGAVTIRVLEGALSGATASENKLYSTKRLASPLKPLFGKPVTKESAEEALLRINDFPGVQVFGTFRPGGAVGETEIVVQVRDTDRFDWFVGADNHGTDSTGEYRFRAGVGWNNPLGLGDRLSVEALQAFNPQGSLYGSLLYKLPLGFWWSSLNLRVLRNDFEVEIFPESDGESEQGLDSLRLLGTTDVGELRWRSDFLRGRKRNAWVGLQYVVKRAEVSPEISEAGGSGQLLVDDDITTYGIDGGFDLVDNRFKGVNVGSMSLVSGESENAFGGGEGVTQEFIKANLRFYRLQALSERQFLLARIEAQYADSDLPSLEQYSVGGPGNVRGVPVSSLLHQSAYFGSLEYQVYAPGFSDAPVFGRTWGELLHFSVFVDYLTASTDANNDDDSVGGYGVGVEFNLPDALLIRLQAAQPFAVDADPSDRLDDSETQFYFQIQWNG